MFENLARVTAVFCQEECHSQAGAKRFWHHIKRRWHVSTNSVNGRELWKKSTTVGENFRESTRLVFGSKALPVLLTLMRRNEKFAGRRTSVIYAELKRLSVCSTRRAAALKEHS